MKKYMLILTLVVAALCGCAVQQPTTLETPESSVQVEATPETSREATDCHSRTNASANADTNSSAYCNTGTHRSPDC